MTRLLLFFGRFEDSVDGFGNFLQDVLIKKKNLKSPLQPQANMEKILKRLISR